MKRLLILICTTILTLSALASEPKTAPSYLALSGSAGSVLPTCGFFSGEMAIPLYSSESLKYIFTSPGDRWQQIAYGLPYYGIGVARTQFGRSETLGDPISLYLLQGATISQLSQRLAINYEVNLGMASGWVPYDPFTNRDNIAIGSSMNVHVAANIYLKWYLSRQIDLHLGATIFHASNGSSRQPNLGLNSTAIYLEMAYNFNREQIEQRYDASLEVPHFIRHLEHDFQVIMSSKNSKIVTEEDAIPNGLNDRHFNIYGINHYSMHATSYKYKYGFGTEFLYDESSNAKMYRKFNDYDQLWYEVTDLAPMRERLSVGLTLRGEIVMPLYSIFADVGYSIIQPNKEAERFYQSIGVKVPLQQNIYGTFGIRAMNFSQAQFLYWSLGYTFNKR